MNFLPAGPRLELLKIALEVDPCKAADQWKAWLNYGLQPDPRLLPLLYRRLSGATGRRAYRYHWTRNQRLARTAAQAIDLLQRSSVRVIVLKGLALACSQVLELGSRPMNDFDLLISAEQRSLAVDVLQAHGWQAQGRLPEISAQHALEFCNASGESLDLHWHASATCCWTGADSGFWRRAVPLSIQNVETLTLAPSDMLLLVCLHGARDGSHPLGWSSDAGLLLSQAIDFTSFVEEVGRRRASLSLLLTLGFLAQHFPTRVPLHLLGELQNIRVTMVDRLYFWSKLRGGHGWAFWAGPILDFLRGERTGILEFFRRRWNLSSKWELPGHAWHRLQSRRTHRQ